MTIDARLVSLYKEYTAKGEENKFLAMLKDIQKESARAAYAERTEIRNRVKAIKEKMTLDQLVAFLDTPYDNIPDSLKDDKLVRNPQQFNFVRFSNPEIGLQKETFGARLVRYMNDHGFTTEENKLNYEKFAEICNDFAMKFDTKTTPSRKGQKTRITKQDLKNYTYFNVSPKTDKMTAIAEAMGVDIKWLAGYEDNKVPASGLYGTPQT